LSAILNVKARLRIASKHVDLCLPIAVDANRSIVVEG